jgi:hypothetical protein
VSAHHDDELLGVVFANFTQGFNPISPWHPDVEENQVGVFIPNDPAAFFTVLRNQDAKALILEDAFQAFADAGFIIDDQNAFHFAPLFGNACLGWQDQAGRLSLLPLTGSSTMKRLPLG